jgi:hypothetical protein
LSGRNAQREITPIDDLVAAPRTGYEHQDKAGHPRAIGINFDRQEVH